MQGGRERASGMGTHGVMWGVAAAAASAVMYRLAIPPPAWWPLGWVCLVPMLWAVRNASVARALWLGVLFGVGWAAWHGYAGYVAATGLFQRPWYSGLAAAFFATAYFAAWPGLAFALYALLRRRFRWRFVPAAVAGWCGVDVLHTYAGFLPGNLLGASQAAAPVFLQTAEFGGAAATGAVMVAVNALLAQALVEPPERRRRSLVLAVSIFVAAGRYGRLRIAQIDAAAARPTVRELRVGLVQPDFARARLRGELQEHFAQLGTLVRLAYNQGVDVVLVPESTGGTLAGVPYRVGQVPADRWLMAGVTEDSHVARAPGDAPAGPRNLAVWIDGSSGVHPTPYAKRRLFPVAESRIFGLERLVIGFIDTPRSGWVQPGPRRPVAFEGDGWRVTPLICLEVLFASTVRESARTGADWIAVLSNDEWFDGLPEPLQHLTNTAVVAVQTRRPVARATNTGVSGAFDAAGRPLPVEIHDLPGRQVQGIPVGTLRSPPAQPSMPTGPPAVGLVSLRLGAADPLAGRLPPWWLGVPLLAWGWASKASPPTP